MLPRRFTQSKAASGFMAALLVSAPFIAKLSVEGLTPDAYWFILIQPVFILMSLSRERGFLFTATTGASFLSSFNGNPTILAIASSAAFLGFLAFYVKNRGDVKKTVTLTLLFYTPLYIVNPYSLVPLATIVAGFTVCLLRESARIGRSRVEVRQVEKTVYVGAHVNYLVTIKCPGFFEYKVFTDRNEVRSGSGVNRVELELAVKALKVGVNKANVEVVVRDGKGLASTVHGPYVLEYTVIIKATQLLKEAEKILREYARYIVVPRILVVRLGGGGAGEYEAGRGPAQGGLGYGSTGEGFSGGEKGVGIEGGEILKEQFALSPGLDTRDSAVMQSEGEVVESSSNTSTWGKQYLQSRFYLATKMMREVAEYVSKIIAQSRIGDYMGVREYAPGDNPHLIHWKRSLRLELEESLYIRLFTSEVEGGGGRGLGERIVYLDLAAANPLELDLLVTTAYGELISGLRGNGGLTNIHFFVKIPGEELYYIPGRIIDVLAAFNNIIRKHSVKALYDYSTWSRMRTIKLGEATGFVGELEDYYKGLATGLVEVFKSKAGGVKSVTMIFSKSLAYKYGVIAAVLRDSGFFVNLPGG